MEAATNEFDDTIPQSRTRDRGSTAALMAMIVCSVILLLMLAACSPPAHASACGQEIWAGGVS